MIAVNSLCIEHNSIAGAWQRNAVRFVLREKRSRTRDGFASTRDERATRYVSSASSVVPSQTSISTTPAARLLPFARCSQFAVEEFGSGPVGADPIAPAKEVVNFVGDD